jgi:D-beta-D-heptose 7-phosphate kinase/D-beta-D-heptose 1-phosphate adenosyltransferase
VSNVAGALSVSKEGVSTISIQELNEACVKWGVIEDKTKKPKIGFCNGCFDLFHPGHMWFLWQAAQQCDKLVVGLNTDISVAKLKGENRPKQPFAIRKQIIQSLHFIEEVVLVEDPDEYLIEKKRFGSVPDIVFRGPDQKAPPEGINWIRICPPIPIAQFSTTSQLKK